MHGNLSYLLSNTEFLLIIFLIGSLMDLICMVSIALHILVIIFLKIFKKDDLKRSISNKLKDYLLLLRRYFTFGVYEKSDVPTTRVADIILSFLFWTPIFLLVANYL